MQLSVERLTAASLWSEWCNVREKIFFFTLSISFLEAEIFGFLWKFKIGYALLKFTDCIFILRLFLLKSGG